MSSRKYFSVKRVPHVNNLKSTLPEEAKAHLQGSGAIDNNDDTQTFILIHYVQPKSIFNASNAKIIVNYIQDIL
jgi:hypothetical protein